MSAFVPATASFTWLSCLLLILCCVKGQTQTSVPHVSFSIKPNTTMVTRLNSNLTIFWQVRDQRCLEPGKWRLKVATRDHTLLNYPPQNTSEPDDNYADYKVIVVPETCESNEQKINVTLTIFMSENVDIDEYVFCRISFSNSDPSNTSKVHFVLNNTTSEPINTITASTTVTVTETPVTDYIQPYTTSSVAHTKGMLYALFISIVALFFH